MRQRFKAILPKELIQRSNFAYMLTKSTLNRLYLKTTGIFKCEGQYLTFPFNKNHQICTKIKLLICDIGIY